MSKIYDGFGTCKDAWLQWNINGVGKDANIIGDARYSGPVLYYNNTPHQRIVHRPRDGLPVVLVRYGNSRLPDWAKEKAKVLIVPDIAVFSRHPGDWYDDLDDIHGRVKYLCLLEAQDNMEKILRMPVTSLDPSAGAKPRYGRRSTWAYDSHRNAISSAAEQWRQYSYTFNLNWGEFPGSYLARVDDYVRMAKAKYHDPENVARRERQKARRVAKEALGVA